MSTVTEDRTTNPLDDQGTDDNQARAIITRLRDQAFGGSNEQLATALGRPVEEVEGWLSGGAALDDDVVMKGRGIAQERGVDLAERPA